MQFLLTLILKPLYKIFFKCNLIDEKQYQNLLNQYYCQKTKIFAKLHNFMNRKNVIKYFNQHTASAKAVIYTCITGNYDELLIPGFINPEYDYVCFTDDEEMIKKKYIGPWKISPLQYSKSDNSKNNRWHKMHPHILFPNYDSSIYIDSNVNIKTNKLFEYIKKLPTDCVIALPKHSKRDCIYDEANFVIKAGLDNKETVELLIKRYREKGFPDHFGLAENNIIFRKHNEASCIKLMQDWWQIFSEYFRRDQLSLFYLLWKDKIKFAFFSPNPLKKDHKNFRIYKHKKMKVALLKNTENIFK